MSGGAAGGALLGPQHLPHSSGVGRQLARWREGPGLGWGSIDLLGVQEQLWWGYLVHEFVVMFEAAYLAKSPEFGWARRQNCVVGQDRVLLLM